MDGGVGRGIYTTLPLIRNNGKQTIIAVRVYNRFVYAEKVKQTKMKEATQLAL